MYIGCEYAYNSNLHRRPSSETLSLLQLETLQLYILQLINVC